MNKMKNKLFLILILLNIFFFTKVNFGQAPNIFEQPYNKQVCTGSSTTFIVFATGNGLTYQWRKGNINLTNGGNISGATSSKLTITSVSFADTASNYNVIVSGTIAPNDTSINVSLMLSDPTIIIEPINKEACVGSIEFLSVAATGTGLTYQWRKGNVNLTEGGNIFGTKTSTLIFNPVTINDDIYDYNVVVSGFCPSKDTSVEVYLEVFNQPMIISQPANQTVCTGDSAVFSVVATGRGITYQWRKGNVNLSDGGNISGATSVTLTINPVSIADTASDYNVVVSGICSPDDISINASLNLINPIIINEPDNQSVCKGSQANISVSATGMGLSYQWRKGNMNLTDGGNISGATTAMLTINSVGVSDTASDYNVIVKGMCSPNDTSINVSLKLIDPIIVSDPSDQSVCVGGNANFSVKATGTNIMYQWRKGNMNLTNGGNISGATSDELNINPVGVTDGSSDYYVIVTGLCSPNDTTIHVSLNLENPMIISQPNNKKVCIGSNVFFSVAATGTGLTYQWRKGNVNLTNGGNISNVTTATLSINPVSIADTASDYNVVISGFCPPNDTSIYVSLSLENPIIIEQPASKKVCLGSKTFFSVAATGTGLTYQWRKGNKNLTDVGNISGSNTATLTIDPVSIADTASDYHVLISGFCPSTVTSINVSLMLGNPKIVDQATDQEACIGSAANFSVAAEGIGLTFQWRKGNINLTNGGNISNATSATMTINPVSINDTASDYNVVVSGFCSPNDTSYKVSLFVDSLPEITLNPTDQTVCKGATVSFSVTAQGNGLTYQWRKGNINLTDGGNISGSKTAVLTINPVSISDVSINYNVIVSGKCIPYDTSNYVSLNLTNPVITKEPIDQSVCVGSTANLSVTATGIGLMYQWRKGNNNLVDGVNISGATTANLTINSVTNADTSSAYYVVVSGICPPNDTSKQVTIKFSNPIILSEPTNQTVCSGSPSHISVMASGTGLTYQWRKGNVNLTDGGNISGTSTADISFSQVSITDTASDYNVIVYGMCSSNDTSVNAKLIVNTRPEIQTEPTSQTVCVGSTVDFTVIAKGSGLTYQWMKGNSNLINGGNISGADSSTLILQSVGISDVSSVYRVVVSGICPMNDTSDYISLNLSNPIITKEPISQSVCEGSSVNLKVEATGKNLVYQWRKNKINLSDDMNISGSNSAMLNFNSFGVTDTSSEFDVIVSGICPPNDTSIHVSLSINSIPKITSEPSGQKVCVGGSVKFSVTAEGTGIMYQWRKGNLNLKNGGNISGVNTSTLILDLVNIADVTSDYNVIVSGKCLPADTSINVSLELNNPIILSEPVNQTVCAGSDAVFSVLASGTGQTYQWRRGNVNLIDGGNISGATTAMLTIKASKADIASDYNVIVYGICSPNDTSVNVSLNLSNPIITKEPLSQNVCEGSSINLTIEATGNALAYQWRKNKINLTDDLRISGSNSAVLKINSFGISDTSSEYDVVVSGICPPNDTSIHVALSINSIPKITSEPTGQTVCVGGSVKFSITAEGTGIMYQWRKGNINLKNGGNISGVNSATLILDPINIADVASDYNVIVSGKCLPADTSINVSLELNNPIILSEPVNQTLCAGSDAVFSVLASGTGLTYQWRRGNKNLNDGGTISGATTSTLTIKASEADVASDYNVIVYGICSPNDTSVNVSLNLSNPIIITEPVGMTVCTGSSVQFSVIASGTGLKYQWRKENVDLTDGVNISGATTSQLKINSVSLSDVSSNYHVVVSGLCPSNDTSLYVPLIINSKPEITKEPESQIKCEGSAVSLSVTAIGTGLTYQWRKGNQQLTDDGNITGTSSSILSFKNLTVADESSNYNVIVSGQCSPNDTSVHVALLVHTSPQIITEPVNQTVCAGSSVSFSIKAVGTGISYQWRKGNLNLMNDGIVSGATSPTLTINSVYTTDTASNYYVIVSGICSPDDTSGQVKLMLNTGTEITTEPINQIVCVGSAADFSVTATGTGLTYQWRKGKQSLTDDGNISGTTSSLLSFKKVTLADDASNYNVIVSGICLPNDTSIEVTLKAQVFPEILTEPANLAVCLGSSANFSVNAIGAGLTYQWRKGSVNLTDSGNMSGAKTSTLTVNPVSIADVAANYNVIISGICPMNDTSINVSLNLANPIIITEPKNKKVCNGSSAIFTVAATGSGLSYQWRKGTVNLSNGGNISDVTTSALTINPVSTLDIASDYNVIVSGTCSPNDTSVNVSLSVDQLPVAVSSGNSPVCTGNTINLFAQTVPGGTYQWTNTLGYSSIEQNPVIQSASLKDSDVYTLIVSLNGCHSIASNVSIVVKNCNSDLSVVKTANEYYPFIGQTIVFTITATNNGPYDATGVTVTDILQSGYSYVSSTKTTGTIDFSSGVWTIGNMKNGATEVLTITVNVNVSGSYVNTAVIQGVEPDGNLVNNTSTIETHPTDFNIPEGFSPNGDGVNDLFVIRGILKYSNNTIVIFNRWGNKIFEATPYQNTWDGRSAFGLKVGGDELPVGTYFYILDLGNSTDVIKGTIYLNR